LSPSRVHIKLSLALSVLLVAGCTNGSAQATDGAAATSTNSADRIGVAPPVERVSDDWPSAPSVTDGVAFRYPSDWHAEQSIGGTQVVLRQPDSPTDRPVPTISVSFEPGVVVRQPQATDGMSAPEAIGVAGLQGWEYHQVGLVTPAAADFIDLPYSGGRLQISATRGPTVDLVPQMEEMLKTLEVAK
jgi:hypothetical protein